MGTTSTFLVWFGKMKDNRIVKITMTLLKIFKAFYSLIMNTDIPNPLNLTSFEITFLLAMKINSNNKFIVSKQYTNLFGSKINLTY